MRDFPLGGANADHTSTNNLAKFLSWQTANSVSNSRIEIRNKVRNNVFNYETFVFTLIMFASVLCGDRLLGTLPAAARNANWLTTFTLVRIKVREMPQQGVQFTKQNQLANRT
jgi:hypothetical protein